jgi:hypothetical protein
METRPDPVSNGTLVLIVVDVEDVTLVIVPLKRTTLLLALVSKFVPVIAMAVPATPTVGLKLVMVGAPIEPVTVNGAELEAEPAGVVTSITPLVAPAGTVAINVVGLADVIMAAVLLNLTVFCAGTSLKVVP